MKTVNHGKNGVENRDEEGRLYYDSLAVVLIMIRAHRCMNSIGFQWTLFKSVCRQGWLKLVGSLRQPSNTTLCSGGAPPCNLLPASFLHSTLIKTGTARHAGIAPRVLHSFCFMFPNGGKGDLLILFRHWALHVGAFWKQPRILPMSCLSHGGRSQICGLHSCPWSAAI